MEYITTAQAAKILDTSTSYIARLCRTGILSATKFGRDWQITLSSVEEYKKQQNKN